MAEQIVAELILDDGKYSVKMKGASKEARAFKREVERLNSSMHRMEKSMRGPVAVMRDWAIIIGQSRNVMHQLWFVTGQWMQSIIKTSAEVERLTFLMRGLSDAGDEAARNMEAAANVDALFEMAREAPFAIESLADSFVKFQSVGIDPLEGGMKSLVDAVAAFGGTDETLHRASIAIQQMAGKGVISMEELRQQLGEAVPQAVTIMADSLGVTYGELVKKISEGRVEAKAALDAMFTGFEIAFGGRAQAMMKTYNGRVAQMKTAWAGLLKESDGIQAFFESKKQLITSITDFLDSEFAGRMADRVGNFLSSMLDVLSSLISNAEYLSSQFWALVGVVNNAVLDPDSFINTLWTAFTKIAEVGREVLSILGLVAKESALGLLNMSEQDFKDAMLKERIRNGADFLETELGELMDLQNRTTEELKTSQENLAEAMAKVRKAAISEAGEFVASGGSIIGIEQMRAALQEYASANTRLAQLRDERDRKMQRLAHIEAAMGKGYSDRAGMIEHQNMGLEKEEILDDLEAMDAEISAVKDRWFRLGEGIKSFARDAGMSVEEFTRAAAGDLDGLREKFGSITDETFLKSKLQEMAQGSNEAMANAAQQVLDLQEKIQDLSQTEVDLGEILKSEMDEKVEQELDRAMEAIEKFNLEASSTGQKMLEEARQAMTDDTLASEEARYQKAAEIVNSYFDQQLEGLNAILAASQEAMLAQGVAGQMAAAQLAEQVDAILEALNSRRESLLGNLKKGIPLVNGGSAGGSSAAASAMKRLEEMIESAGREAEELGRRMNDPFAYELPKSIESARRRIDRLADKISGGKWTQQMQDLFNTIASNTATEELLKMADATRKIQRELSGERASREEVFREEVQRIRSMKERLIEMGIWRMEWEQIVLEHINALREQFEAQSPWGEFMSDWKDYFDDMEGWAVDSIKSVSQALADMVTEGKANFEDLARAALNSFLEIQFNAMLSGVGDIIAGSLRGTKFGSWIGVSHSGDIAGKGSRGRFADMSMFLNAPRYHTGGVIGQEVPAILEKGEGVFTPEQMKAIGKGMSGPREAKVNIINNSPVPVEAENTGVKFSAEGMILDVVLKEVQRPGPFRDSMKRAMK